MTKEQAIEIARNFLREKNRDVGNFEGAALMSRAAVKDMELPRDFRDYWAIIFDNKAPLGASPAEVIVKVDDETGEASFFVTP